MTDCLIVGGGVIGLSLAYELSRHSLRVCVLDRAEPGGEASWAGAGILPPANLHTAVDPLEQLRGLSHQLHGQWAKALREQTGIDNGFRRCGGLYVARSVGEAAALAGLAEMFRSLEIAVERLSLDALRDLEPALAPAANAGRLKAAYLVPDEAQLRNPRHLKALVAACRRRGVEVQSGVEVVGFETRGNRLEKLHTNRGVRTGEKICLASGAWTFQLLEQLGVRTGILPVRGQMVLLNSASPLFRRVINEGPRYLVPRDDGRVLVGSTEEEAGFDKSTTEEAIGELQDLAFSLVPQLWQATVEQTWAGLRPGTFDGLPYMGPVPGLDNTLVAAGHFRSGLHMSTGTAVVMAKLIRGESPQIDLTPFRVSRG